MVNIVLAKNIIIKPTTKVIVAGIKTLKVPSLSITVPNSTEITLERMSTAASIKA